MLLVLAFQTGFNFANAAVVCAILDSISGLEPLSAITEPRYLKIVTVSRFCQFNLCIDTTGVVCHQPGVFGTNLHATGCGGFVKTTNFSSSSSSPAKPLISSANRDW